MSTYTWVRKALDVARLPRVRLNNIQDLPGAKKKVTVLQIDTLDLTGSELWCAIFRICKLLRQCEPNPYHC